MSDDRFDEPTKRTVSRRDFLKMAGVAGVAVGASAGLGGLLAACGGTEESTTTTAAATTTTAGATTTTAGATTTSASAGVETGAELKMGFVAPLTGPLASFGVPDTYCADRWNEASETASSVATARSTPSASKSWTASPTRTERHRSPATSSTTQGRRHDGGLHSRHGDPGRGAVRSQRLPGRLHRLPVADLHGGEQGVQVVLPLLLRREDFFAINESCYSKIPSNKTIGALFDNTADGYFFSANAPQFMEAKGYKVVDPCRTSRRAPKTSPRRSPRSRTAGSSSSWAT